MQQTHSNLQTAASESEFAINSQLTPVPVRCWQKRIFEITAHLIIDTYATTIPLSALKFTGASGIPIAAISQDQTGVENKACNCQVKARNKFRGSCSLTGLGGT